MAKTVLIIDDDPVICQVIENILYQFDYKVSTAANTFGDRFIYNNSNTSI